MAITNPAGWLASPQSPFSDGGKASTIAPDRSSRVDMLRPEDILFYSMRHEKTTCACGSEQRTSRLWLTYQDGRQRVGRALGKSETIYDAIELHETYIEQSTAACPICIDARLDKAERWTAAKNTNADPARSNVLGDPARESRGGSNTTSVKHVKAAKSAAGPSLADLMAKVNAKKAETND